MLSISKLFESNQITPGQLFKSSGKMIGAGLGLGLSGLGKTLDITGRKLHNNLTSNPNNKTEQQEDSTEPNKNKQINHHPVVYDSKYHK